jgi:hypothetical protein
MQDKEAQQGKDGKVIKPPTTSPGARSGVGIAGLIGTLHTAHRRQLGGPRHDLLPRRGGGRSIEI